MNIKFKGHLLAIVTVSIWSSTFIITKILLSAMLPLQILFVRFIISIIVLFIIYPKISKPKSIKSELFFIASGFSLALYFYFENSALKHTFSSNVSLIVATIPLITGLLSTIFFKTNYLNKSRLFGFALSYIGVATIILTSSQGAKIYPIGDIFALFAAIMFSFYSLFVQQVQKDFNLIEMTRKIFIYSFILLTGITLIEKQNPLIFTLSPNIIISMLFLGVVASSFAFLLWNKSIEYIGSISTNQYIYLVPIITTLLSCIIFSEKISIYKIFGTILIIGGLYIAETKESSIN